MFFSIFLLPGDGEDHIAGFVKFEIVKELCDPYFLVGGNARCDLEVQQPHGDDDGDDRGDDDVDDDGDDDGDDHGDW